MKTKGLIPTLISKNKKMNKEQKEDLILRICFQIVAYFFIFLFIGFGIFIGFNLNKIL